MLISLESTEQQTALMTVTVSSSWTKYYKKAKDLKILRQAPPPSRLPVPSPLPDVTHVTFSQAFPLRFSPPFLRTASDQKLEAGTAWE